MAFRDSEVVLRERIERLELSLARTTGRVMRLTDERDALQAELERLTGDPKALARVRRAMRTRSALFVALRIVGVIGIVVAILPMVAIALFLLIDGKVGSGLLCGLFPLSIVAGILALKLPDLVHALELRLERRQRAR